MSFNYDSRKSYNGIAPGLVKMKIRAYKPDTIPVISLIILTLILPACTRDRKSCPTFISVNTTGAEEFVIDTGLPFRFPLDDESLYDNAESFMTVFSAAALGETRSTPKYHAAEDYIGPAGTPVYSMANGEVSFSGKMGGYGWLVIIDHHGANLYSLYGHLSPSNWSIEPGPVMKGELIGYLGDSKENGGSKENPLVSHLHFGVRAGQRKDYSGEGNWRWQAGWIKSCPGDLGWLQPSVIIMDQTIPEGGFPVPDSTFLSKWWIELLFTVINAFGAVSVIIYSYKKNKNLPLFMAGFIFIIAGCVYHNDGWRIGILLFALSAILITYGLLRKLLPGKFCRNKPPAE